MSERHTRQNRHAGSVGNTERARRGGSKQVLPVIAGRGCWCGEPQGHDWPGKADGEPHPREKR